jgi:branched-chain amino acid transport system permease protein
MGVDPVKVKLAVTMMSAALTAVGGFFYAQYILFLDPPSVFSINVSVQIALLSIIGGLGTPLGPIVGSLIMTPLDGVLSQFFGGGPRLMIYGAALLAAVLLAPQGIVGTIQSWRRS